MELKLRNWILIVKDRKPWNDLVQTTKTHTGFVVSKEKTEGGGGDDESTRVGLPIFPHQNHVRICLLPSACHILHPSHSH